MNNNGGRNIKKNNIFMVLALLSLLLISIGSISAADNQEDIISDSSDIKVANQDINNDVKDIDNNNENDISSNKVNIISDNQNVSLNDNNEESLYSYVPVNNDDNAILYDNNTAIDSIVYDDTVLVNESKNVTINNTTFNNYFDENGILKSNVTQDLLIFEGNFSNLPNLTINKNITLDGSNASFYDMGITITTDDVTIKGFTFNVDSLDTLINVLANNILITNNIINFNLMNDNDNVVIRIENSNNITINDNIITVKGNNTSEHSSGVILSDNVNNLVITNNNINAKLPSASNTYGPAPDYNTEYGSYVIQTTGNENSISNNNISLEYTNVAGSYDSIYAVIVSGSNNNIINNNINVKGKNYAYGVCFDGKNINIDSNIININSENYYSSGISTSTGFNASGIISNNNITVKSKNVTYGTASYGDVNLIYENNTITADSNSIYAMELMGVNETVIGNTIVANGNYTIGIASSGDSILSIKDNTISVTGEGLGNATVGDSINSINAAIYLTEYTSNVIISGNTINANIPSRPWDIVAGGLVINSENTVIDNNDIAVKVTNAQGDYNSIYGVNINADDVTFNNNILSLEGGQYAYALSVSGKDMSIDSNNITVITNTYVNGISLSSFNGIVNNNIINATAIDHAYGIYSSAWDNNTVIANYTNNKITVNSNVSYAIELLGTEEIVSNNNIIANGNYTMAIATNTPIIIINNNTIRSNGVGKTNGSSVDMFGATNQGILIYDNNTKANITGNNITATATYAVNVLRSENNLSTVTNNYLVANNLIGNSAVNNITGTVKNNIPTSSGILSAEDIVKYYRNGTQFSVTVLDENENPVENQNVTFNIAGKEYKSTTDKNGVATLVINLDPGEYIINSTYNNYTISNTITVLPIIVDNEDLVKYFRNGSQYSVKILDDQGNPVAGKNVDFNINGKIYTKSTDENGIATLNINLNPGEYVITATYNNCIVSNNIKVLSVIETENIEMTTSKRVPFTAKILGSNGQPAANQKVSFNINGVFYNKITDSNGIANLNINLHSGRYIISTIYNGQVKSNTVNIL